jgi:hypothetical protein
MKITKLSNRFKKLCRITLSRHNIGKNTLSYIGSLLLTILFFSSFMSCNDTSPTIRNNFESQKYGISVNLPDNWASAEGPETLMIQAYDGLLAFNSWGKAGFWIHASEIKRPEVSGSSFSAEVIAAQIPAGGSYIALMASSGPPDSIGYTPDEYNRNDLSGLYTEHDWRQDEFPRVYIKDFYKAKTHLSLVIACKKDASDATVAQLNALLKSWKFTNFSTEGK